MAPRRRIRRPWYRTRVYRLTRTAALTVTLMAGAVWWARAEEPADTAVSAARPAGSAVVAGDARGPDRQARPRSGSVPPPDTGEGTPGARPEQARYGTGLSGPARPPEGAPSPAAHGAGAPSAHAGKPRRPAPSARPGRSRQGVPSARTRQSPPGGPSAGAARQSPQRAEPSRPRPTRPVSPPPGPRRPPSTTGTTPAPGAARAGTPRPGTAAHPSPRHPSDRPRSAAPLPGAAGAPRAATPRPRPAPKSPHALPRSRATRLAIPYLGLDAPVMDLRLDAGRRLPAPPEDDPELVGWYADGPSPGGPGTAVAVGHLDTDTGPAVFSGLSELSPGRRIEVRRADGRTAVYRVDRIRNYEKANFPDQEVYGDRGRPELRLITCGGTFDRRSGYSGNLVVFAHLTQIRDRAGPAR
ncbi:class F sortase [Streptomyces sp. NPDC101213]|uniref:class F sortase n=1 Tax=Streptomyces sp. NPDC101213 TaxID=3366130 RepID=UPI0038139C17